MRKLVSLCSLLAAIPFLSQTPPTQKLSFEVASIKLGTGKFQPTNFPLDISDSVSFSGGAAPHGRLINDAPLLNYIQFAYKLWLTRQKMNVLLAHVPKWASTENYAINAKAEGNPTKDEMRLMMQSLLADRFKL